MSPDPAPWVPGPPDRDGWYWVTISSSDYRGLSDYFVELVKFSFRGQIDISFYYQDGLEDSFPASDIVAHIPVATEKPRPFGWCVTA
jgi:hypothetical protein